MRDPFSWSVTVGRWFGLEIRLHAFLLVFALGTFYLCWPETGSNPTDNMLWIAVGSMVLLFASVLAHEISHWLVARQLKLPTEAIVLGPFGGVTQWRFPPSAREELRFLAAGPFANLLICLVCLCVLLVIDTPQSIWPVFNPIKPAWSADTAQVVHGIQFAHWINVALWINWLLFLVNLLPGYPFDGGRALHAALALWRSDLERTKVAGIAFWVAVATSGAIMALALFLWKNATTTILFPTWFALAILAVVLLVGARRDADAVTRHSLVQKEPRPTRVPLDDAEWDLETWDQEEGGLESDSGDGAEVNDEQRVDEILSHVHAYGMESLTAEQREFLQRVSAQYRNRSGERE